MFHFSLIFQILYNYKKSNYKSSNNLLVVRVEGERNSKELLDSGRRFGVKNASILPRSAPTSSDPTDSSPSTEYQQKMPFGHSSLVLVRVEGVEPSSYPWEGYIIAVIRHPRIGIF